MEKHADDILLLADVLPIGKFTLTDAIASDLRRAISAIVLRDLTSEQREMIPIIEQFYQLAEVDLTASVRNDGLAKSGDISYPDMLVLARTGVPLKNPGTKAHVVKNGRIIFGNERLVLLFNESKTPKKVEVENLGLTGETWTKVWEKGEYVKGESKMTLLIPPGDLLAVHVIECPAK